MTGAATPRYGVLGWPVGHSRSPAMMRAAGLERYQRLPVAPAVFDDTVRALGAAGFRGANVTIPHKEAALALATSASDAAREIGAANTLSFGEDGSIAADNTDAPGLLAALGRAPASALVLGAGGSARAAIWALTRAGADVCVW
ncbi:MAG: shikimate dehydrogenase, partial [bacterium]